MKKSFTVIFLLILSYNQLGVSQDECSINKYCSGNGPSVRFPFVLKGHHPTNCGYPGFELSCTSTNETMVDLPFSGKFTVIHIDYIYQRLEVIDSNGCIIRRIQRNPLNLSNSPFHQDEEYKTKLSLFNCSTVHGNDDRVKDFDHISCLGTSGYEAYAISDGKAISDGHIYTIGELSDLQSCQKFQSIDFNLFRDYSTYSTYYPYHSQFFIWDTSICADCGDSLGCRFKNTTRSSFVTECFKLHHRTEGTDTSQNHLFWLFIGIGISQNHVLRLLIGLLLGFILFLIMMVTAIKSRKYKLYMIERQYQVKIDNFLKDYQDLKPTRYLYEDIKKMTNQLKDILGKGGFGSVYKGMIGNDLQVAVKILNDFKGKGEDFTNEMATIGRIHHVNIVRLVGFCSDGIKKALVYEYMPNESLEKYIFSEGNTTSSLGWEKLQEIAIGIAKGIEYLHQGCDQRILHFDIKPHNILLDQNLKPKISDFGLAKLASRDASIVSMTVARGTIGYIAPEVFSRNFGNVSYKSDVYSFGMLVLEMVGGRKNTDNTAANSSQVYYPEWAYNHLNREEELGLHIDMDEDRNIVKKLTMVALWCIQWYPADRPSMTVVVHMLEGETENLAMPSNPFFSTDQPKTSSTKIEKPSHTILSIIPEIDESD